MANNLETLEAVMTLEKSQSAPVDSASFFMVIKGHEDLSVQIQSGGLPMPKRGAMDYSTMVGVKSGASGKIQNWQTMPLSFIEREDITTNQMMTRLLADNYEDRNNLDVEYWVGNARDVESIKWATLKYAFLSNEEGGEFDTEGEDTPLKLSGASINGWLVLDCPDRDPVTLANAVALLQKLKANQGLEHC